MATRILVINDTQEILEMFRAILEDEGYEVVLSSFPVQKAQEIEQINPQLIILDFIFGERKLGWQMLQLLKMQRSTAKIPIIICTAAESAVRDQEGYLVSQGIQIVYKPFDLDVLLQAISRALDPNNKTL